MELIVVKAAVTFPSSYTRESRTGDVPPWKSSIFKNTYFTVSCSTNFYGIFVVVLIFPPFLPSLFHMQHRPFTKRNTGGFLRIMIQEKRKGTAALGCFLFTNPNQEALFPLMQLYKAVLSWNQQPNHKIILLLLSQHYHEIIHILNTLVLWVLFFPFYLCFVKEQFF